MTFFIDHAVVCGASSIGKLHIVDNIPNQDFYRIKYSKYGIAMAVCDGVGSNRYSQYGSKAAAKAVEKVVNPIGKRQEQHAFLFLYMKIQKLL